MMWLKWGHSSLDTLLSHPYEVATGAALFSIPPPHHPPVIWTVTNCGLASKLAMRTILKVAKPSGLFRSHQAHFETIWPTLKLQGGF